MDTCRPLGSNFRVILNPLLQTLLSNQSPGAVEGDCGVLLRFGLHLPGGHVSQQMGSQVMHTESGFSFPTFTHPFLHKELTEPWEPAPSPSLCLISLWQLKQDSGLDKGEGGDCQVGPGLACGLQESHV